MGDSPTGERLTPTESNRGIRGRENNAEGGEGRFLKKEMIFGDCW